MERRWESINRANIPVGSPVAEYSNQEYSAIVYGRGALFFEVLREKMGNQLFDAFILDYAKTYSWKITSPEGLHKMAEEHCICDLDS